jgi:hypothetical protein
MCCDLISFPNGGGKLGMTNCFQFFGFDSVQNTQR